MIASLTLGLLTTSGTLAQSTSATATPASEQQAVASPTPSDTAETTAPLSDCQSGFFRRFWKANVEEFQKKDEPADEETPTARRALPAPFDSPPFPSGEYQGYPLIGVPAGDSTVIR